MNKSFQETPEGRLTWFASSLFNVKVIINAIDIQITSLDIPDSSPSAGTRIMEIPTHMVDFLNKMVIMLANPAHTNDSSGASIKSTPVAVLTPLPPTKRV